MKIKLIILNIIALSFLGCAMQMSYSPTSSYSENDFRSINDEDILKAFQAEPQIKLPTKVAWYNMSRDSLIHFIKFESENIITENYDIPKILIEGYEPLFNNQHYRYSDFAQPINFKAVRLFAARAKCDIVILVSSRYEEKRDLNSWATLNILLLPALFTPFWHVEYRYSSDVFVFDVRNGYMYKHINYTDAKKKEFLNVWNADIISEDINADMIEAASLYIQKEVKMIFEQMSK